MSKQMTTEVIDYNIVKLENERREWARKTFPNSTAFGSLQKAKTEIKEIEEEMNFGPPSPIEYVDAIMCLFDSADRSGITAEAIAEAYAGKLERNKRRVWKDNGDGTYSHIKQCNGKAVDFESFCSKLHSMLEFEDNTEKCLPGHELHDLYIEFKTGIFDTAEEFICAVFHDYNPDGHNYWLKDE